MKCAFFLLEKTQILHLYSLISNQMMSLITGAKFVEAKSMLKAYKHFVLIQLVNKPSIISCAMSEGFVVLVACSLNALLL